MSGETWLISLAGGIKEVGTYAAIVETSQEEASIVPTFKSSIFNDKNSRPLIIVLEKELWQAAWWAVVRLKSYLLFFLSPISHINGDIAAAAYLWWIKERAIYRIPYSWSSITYGGPTLILEIVKDRKEKQFVLEFVLVEKIVLRWGGETEQYLLLKSLKQFAKNIFSFFYVRIFVFFSLFNLFDWFA